MQEKAGIVYVTSDEMRRIDDVIIREFQVDVLMLMENAGRATAIMGLQMLQGRTIGKRVACLVGGGNNGGDGMVAARHLANWGANVEMIVGTIKDRMKNVPLGQLHILEKMGIPILSTHYILRDYDLLIDGLIGYGLEDNPRDRIATIIKDANASGRPILALDVPSGMNATTGKAYDPCIKATATLTLALPKTGFLAPGASLYVGDLYLADISIPRNVYQRFGQQNILFQKDSPLKI
ncbi:NAD(P)H-hydrate epimerase [Candidatus Bathyarchaeota archaeon]|nr:MAG: NAD(P)H-hydrate epimerase [Candidatus Bathyarchaeota archaeon]TMI51308.1 MAG: NAD(P)H-hydrate epimerase [Candidatus Bathyarchaeota archaeon]